MAYDTPNYSLNYAVPTINQIFTASGQVLTSTVAAGICLAQAAQVLSLAGVVTTAGVGSTYKVQLQSGTTVLAGPLTVAAINVGAFSDVAAASQVNVAAGAALSVVWIGTGTASATQATPVFNMTAQFNPQVS